MHEIKSQNILTDLCLPYTCEFNSYYDHNISSPFQTFFYLYEFVNVRLVTFFNKRGRPGTHSYGNKTPQQRWRPSVPQCSVKAAQKQRPACQPSRTKPRGGSAGCAGTRQDWGSKRIWYNDGFRHLRKIWQQLEGSILGLYFTWITKLAQMLLWHEAISSSDKKPALLKLISLTVNYTEAPGRTG